MIKFQEPLCGEGERIQGDGGEIKIRALPVKGAGEGKTFIGKPRRLGRRSICFDEIVALPR